MREEYGGIPEPVIHAAAGSPVVGEWEPVFQFLTVDDAGRPHVCLLSRAEVRVEGDRIALVVTSSSVQHHLERDPRATLCVYTSDSLVHCVADFVRTERSGAWTRYDGVPVVVRIDSLDLPLVPPKFLASADLRAEENWELCAQLLA